MVRSLVGIVLIALVAGGCASAGSPSSPAAPADRSSSRPTLGAQSPTLPASTSAAPSNGTVVRPGEPWIAFQTGGGGGYGIHLVRPDGSGLFYPMSHVPGQFQEHPDWSPDGRQIAFSVTDENGTEDVWIADVDGANARRIADCEAPCVWTDEPAWSPDGRSIVYQERDATGQALTSTLKLYEVAAATAKVLLSAARETSFYQPRWARDGRSLVMELATNGATLNDPPAANAIAIVDLATSPPTVRAITKPSLLANSPDWSQTADLIVFVQPAQGAGFDGDSDLYTISPEATGRTRVTSLAGTGFRALQPSFTPDGRTILFVREQMPGGFSALASVRLDGTGLGPATSSGWLEGVHPQLRPTP